MATTIHDLPDVILSNIFAVVEDTRSRNSLSLVNRKFLALERATRYSLTLRGNVRDGPHRIPVCFRSVRRLDLSLLSPWGSCLLAASPHPDLLAHRLRVAFPLVQALTVYARSPETLHTLLLLWPGLVHVKLVRWHQRPSNLDLGGDLAPVFELCPGIKSLDLSTFYYWTDDVTPALRGYPDVGRSLTSLDLLTVSLTDGFKSGEIRDITAACGNLTRFLVACVFDPAYVEFVEDETLAAVARNCPRLEVLHLVDVAGLAGGRVDPGEEGYSGEDARVSVVGLVDLFSGLPFLTELVLDVLKNVRECSLGLEALGTKCPRLKILKLGGFQGICKAVESRLDGIALCLGLKSLSINKASDLTDMGLIEIARGCCRLAKFELEGCMRVTVKGVRTFACLLWKTLVEVKISACRNLDAAASLKALEPICDRIERLHIDCVCYGAGEGGNPGGDDVGVRFSGGFDLNGDAANDEIDQSEDDGSKRKRCKYSDDANSFDLINGNGTGNGFFGKSWERLTYLSLWIGVGELLTRLDWQVGLYDCPNLEEIRVKIEGDCRGRPKPSAPAFGLACFGIYPRLSKMQLDCSDTIGFALTAPFGQMDLSLWERFFLNGISQLNLVELDYWPPQDRDVNQRSLSLPAAGLLSECVALRKLFIHGTAHEHFMFFLLKIQSLRDVQLREDYYPAPENDMSTEMRVDSCSRFEDALNIRPIAD